MDRQDALRGHDRAQSRLVLRVAGSVAGLVPQVQDAGGEASVLAPDAGSDESHDEVAVLQAPASVGAVEPIDPTEIMGESREIAGPGAPPVLRPGEPPGTVRQVEHRRKPVRTAAQALAGPMQHAVPHDSIGSAE